MIYELIKNGGLNEVAEVHLEVGKLKIQRQHEVVVVKQPEVVAV